jgi:enamine deaminase RidA (YjgF/YER057c/UK114 family)
VNRIRTVDPRGLHQTSYHHVTVVEAGRTAYLAGQCPIAPDGTLVGKNDLAAQVQQVVHNAMTALTAVDARPEDVVRSVVYVVTEGQSVLHRVWQQLTESELGPAFTTAATLLGVASLGYRHQWVEVDLTAALP